MGYREDFKNASRETRWTFWRVLSMALALSVILGATGWIFSTCGEAAEVAREQAGPRALLKKYEWFKDASSQLDVKLADIKVFQGKIDRLKGEYKGTPRNKWARSDTEQISVWESEVAGVKASFNDLAGQYNSQMAKVNWAFL